ncbi:MAG: DUF455 family protein [Myxococcales bacterium]|nr:DUF455 family protein [Myxococcales bacterium]
MTAPTAHAFARALVLATDLDAKLASAPPEVAVEAEPRAPEWLPGPGRPPGLELRRGRDVTVPPIEGMGDRDQRARILHALANHELQAAELFAWALCGFADAPRPFRTGLWKILGDEQRHARAYFARAAALGRAPFDCPVSGHFWNYRARLTTPLAFVCTMGLTFENANLDLARAYADAARAVGDATTAAILDEVADDEVDHVRFAATWVGKLAPGESMLAAYQRTVAFPLGASRARGVELDVDARRRAGLDDEFIAELAAATPTRPGGGPRARGPRRP